MICGRRGRRGGGTRVFGRTPRSETGAVRAASAGARLGARPLGLQMQFGKQLPKNIKDSVNQLRGSIQVTPHAGPAHLPPQMSSACAGAPVRARDTRARSRSGRARQSRVRLRVFQAALQGRCSRMDVEMPYAANFGTEGRKSVKAEEMRSLSVRLVCLSACVRPRTRAHALSHARAHTLTRAHTHPRSNAQTTCPSCRGQFRRCLNPKHQTLNPKPSP